jgi:hypothetical protein
MFKFFKRKNKIDLHGWEKELFSNIFKLLGNDYIGIEKQISEGIIESVRIDSKTPNYYSFRLNIPLLNKYENRKEQLFNINGIRIFDKFTQSYKYITIDLGFGLILGYSIKDVLNFNPDVNKIDISLVNKYYYENDDYKTIEFLFTKDELELINISDVYKVELDGNIYYHIKDLDDGDFIGIDIHKNIYKITHDPFEIIIQNNELKHFL